MTSPVALNDNQIDLLTLAHQPVLPERMMMLVDQMAAEQLPALRQTKERLTQ